MSGMVKTRGSGMGVVGFEGVMFEERGKRM